MQLVSKIDYVAIVIFDGVDAHTSWCISVCEWKLWNSLNWLDLTSKPNNFDPGIKSAEKEREMGCWLFTRRLLLLYGIHNKLLHIFFFLVCTICHHYHCWPYIIIICNHYWKWKIKALKWSFMHAVNVTAHRFIIVNV